MSHKATQQNATSESTTKPASVFRELVSILVTTTGSLGIGFAMSGPIADFTFSKIEGKDQFGQTAQNNLQLCSSEATPKLFKPVVCAVAGAQVAATGFTGVSPGIKIAP